MSLFDWGLIGVTGALIIYVVARIVVSAVRNFRSDWVKGHD